MKIARSLWKRWLITVNRCCPNTAWARTIESYVRKPAWSNVMALLSTPAVIRARRMAAGSL